MHSIESNGTYWKLLGAHGRLGKLMEDWTTIWNPLEVIRNSKELFVRPNQLIWYGGTDRQTDLCIELRYAQLTISNPLILILVWSCFEFFSGLKSLTVDRMKHLKKNFFITFEKKEKENIKGYLADSSMEKKRIILLVLVT